MGGARSSVALFWAPLPWWANQVTRRGKSVKMETFDLEREQSLWEHVVDINLSESEVHPISLSVLAEMGLDLARLEGMPLIYVQTNGTVERREALAALYPGSSLDPSRSPTGPQRRTSWRPRSWWSRGTRWSSRFRTTSRWPPAGVITTTRPSRPVPSRRPSRSLIASSSRVRGRYMSKRRLSVPHQS